MRKHRALRLVAAKIAIVAGLFTSTAWGFENVNMNTRLSVEGGQLVVRWSTRGFHHYNIRWKEGGGPWQQVEREGNKDFRYLSAYRPKVIYHVAVQGCDKALFSRSTCTDWDEVTCGERGNSCAR
jgi:hypothetical protein